MKLFFLFFKWAYIELSFKIYHWLYFLGFLINLFLLGFFNKINPNSLLNWKLNFMEPN
jgi:hypothetical protein